jgi:hypothetical protein
MNDDIHHAFVAAFGAEHQELRRLVQSLHETLGGERPWSREASAESARILGALLAHLKRHFAQEEAGGYLEEALALAPRFTNDAARLLRQHPQLLEATRQTCKTAERAGGEPAVWPQLKDELQSLLKDLMGHEGAENRIVQAAFNTGVEDLD